MKLLRDDRLHVRVGRALEDALDNVAHVAVDRRVREVIRRELVKKARRALADTRRAITRLLRVRIKRPGGRTR